MVVSAYAPTLIEDSLASVAPRLSEKAFRKRLILEAVRHRFGGSPPDFRGHRRPERTTVFGKSFSVDFVALYFLSAYGRIATKGWIDGVPNVRLPRLDFVFRFNPHLVQKIPMQLRPRVFAGMMASGIEPFREDDWEGLRALRAVLSRYYPRGDRRKPQGNGDN
jgi:hypothetical protein